MCNRRAKKESNNLIISKSVLYIILVVEVWIILYPPSLARGTQTSYRHSIGQFGLWVTNQGKRH